MRVKRSVKGVGIWSRRFIFLGMFLFIYVFFIGSVGFGYAINGYGSYYYSYLESCIERSARRYNISPLIIKAIIKVESNWNYRAVNRNRNGSYDVGLMQINSSWFSLLRRYGIYESYLYNPCVNIDVGAWILAQCIQRYGYTWKAVGCYHSPTEARKIWYAHRVYSEYKKMEREEREEECL